MRWPGAVRARAVVWIAVLLALGGWLVAWYTASTGPSLRIVTVGTHPLAVAVDEQAGRVVIADQGTNTARILNEWTGRLVGAVVVGPQPVAIAVDEQTSHAFVVNGTVNNALYPTGLGSVSMLDMRHSTLVRTVVVGSKPVTIAVDKSAHHVFVINALSPFSPSSMGTGLGSVSMLDTRSGRLLRTVTIGTDPGPVAVDETGGHVFVANMLDNTVSMLDAHTGTVLRTIAVGARPAALAIDGRTRRVFVANGDDNSVTVLATGSGTLLHTIPVGNDPAAVAVDERNGRAFGAIANDFGAHRNAPGQVSVLDARDGTPLDTVTVGSGAWAIAVDAATGRVFVANGTDSRFGSTGTVSVLDAVTDAPVVLVCARNAPPALTGPPAATGTRASLRAYTPNGSGDPLAMDATTGKVFIVGVTHDTAPNFFDSVRAAMQAVLDRTMGRAKGKPVPATPPPLMGTGIVSILDTRQPWPSCRTAGLPLLTISSPLIVARL